MGDIVRAEDIPTSLMENALQWIDMAAPGQLADSDTAEEVVAAVLFAAGHHLIDQATMAELGDELAELLPAQPYERGEALDHIVGTVLRAVGVKAL